MLNLGLVDFHDRLVGIKPRNSWFDVNIHFSLASNPQGHQLIYCGHLWAMSRIFGIVRSDGGSFCNLSTWYPCRFSPFQPWILNFSSGTNSFWGTYGWLFQLLFVQCSLKRWSAWSYFRGFPTEARFLSGKLHPILARENPNGEWYQETVKHVKISSTQGPWFVCKSKKKQ